MFLKGVLEVILGNWSAGVQLRSDGALGRWGLGEGSWVTGDGM